MGEATRAQVTPEIPILHCPWRLSRHILGQACGADIDDLVQAEEDLVVDSVEFGQGEGC